jgi:N-acetylneuraminic acid mutarotase
LGTKNFYKVVFNKDFKYSIYSTIDLYNKNDENWPSERHSHSSVFINDEIFIFGGKNEEKYLNDLYKYNLSNKSWKEIKVESSILPPPMSNFSMSK